MNEGQLIEQLPAVLADSWDVSRARLRRETGPVGMGSVTVGVELTHLGSFVAKWVPSGAADALDRGSALALDVAETGLSVGAPLRTSAEALSAPLGSGRVALLRRVRGRPLTGTSPDDQRRMATVLSRVHAARPTQLRSDRYLSESVADVRPVENWIVTGVAAVLDEYVRLPALTWGLVHHDPAPEAFFHDVGSGETSLIDWTGAGEGPLLFDVASALMYLSGPERGTIFLDAYLDLATDVVRRELDEHLAFFARFRGAVQASYFSRRVAEADLTGVVDQVANLAGLSDARRMLTP